MKTDKTLIVQKGVLKKAIALWDYAENEREVYRIIAVEDKGNTYPIQEYGHSLPIGSIHQAELNKETKTAIIL